MKVGIVGAGGRMGRLLAVEVAAASDLVLAGLTARPGSAAVGTQIAGQTVSADPSALFTAADVVIDFTLPAATADHARLAAECGTALLIGTTGLGADEQAVIGEAARRVPVLVAANTSLGVAVLCDLVQRAAATLGPDWDIEIVEMHHRHKIDAPSGTALALGRAAAAGRGVDLATHSDRGRDGHTGARVPGLIGFASLRGGDVVGEHTVVIAGQAERIELTHRATDRRLFAVGAVRAARWLAGRPAGLYSMADMLSGS